jgi:hypothetical protein
MQLLVVGAGASYAEAEQAGLPEQLRPPLMNNFAEKMWREYNPHYLLSAYLRELGHTPGADARQCFIALEKSQPHVNVERFFEYAYNNRDLVVPGHEQFQPSSEYENLLLHGILNPLVLLLVEGLFKQSDGTAPLPLARTVASHLQSGDAVLNLNYDTIFEIGAEQAGHKLVFLPKETTKDSLAISKPHGSMNLMVNSKEQKFCFVRPLFAGSIQPADGSTNFSGFMPPRFNKRYSEHRVAEMIIEATKVIEPHRVIFWGVGLTDSDQDLLDLYRRWCHEADQIDFINPSDHDAQRAATLLDVKICHYRNVEDWHNQNDQ